jgi:RND family efflux transporter MFP subunit
MSRKTIFLKIIIPVVVIIIGVLIMLALIARRPAPYREIKEDPGIIVQLFTVEKKKTEIIVRGTGTVEAAQEVSLIPQVNGRISYRAPQLAKGGFFKKGEVLFRIEDTDYRLALEQELAARAKAEYELATIESQAQIARAEWERLNKGKDVPPNPLVVYEPQLKNAKASLASADASVKRAELDLERTNVSVAFNSRVRSESIDLGQYVRTGTSVAVLSGTNTAEIIVPLPLEDLRWLKIPDREENNHGSPATVQVQIGENLYEWEGYVIRSSGEVDPKSRMMQVIVEIQDPYGLRGEDDSLRPALAVGTFVQVQIQGKMLESVSVIPRAAFRDNSTVWLMDKNHKLRIQSVVPIRIEKENVIIDEGLDNGDMLVLTNISGAANGMKLRPVKNQK